MTEETQRTVGNNFRDQIYFYSGLLKEQYLNLSPGQQQKLKYLAGACGVGSLGIVLYSYFKRDKQTDSQKKSSKENRIDAKFLKRLKFLLGIVVPSFNKDFLRLLALAFVVICRTFISNTLSSLSGDLSKALMLTDKKEFIQLLATSTTTSVLSAILAPTLQYLIDKSALQWRSNLTAYLHSKYLSNMMYYKSAYLNENVKNPDQVITQDVQKFSEGMCGLFANLVKPIADIILYTTKLVELTGWIGPIVIVSYMFLSWIFITIIRPNFSRLTSKYQELQGTFRYTHVRTSTNGESIAFYGGDSLEKSVAESNFEEIYQQKSKMNSIKRNFEILNEFFVFDLPQSISWLLSALPVFFGRMHKHDRGELARDLRYVAAVISHEFSAIGELVKIHTRLSEISGYTNNISNLLETIDDFEKKGKKVSIKEGDSVKFENVDLVTPLNVTLAKSINFEIQPGKNYLITGPNGIGKSSIARLLAGLWPFNENGSITKPGGSSIGELEKIFYIPQKPYNVSGTLRDQIIYPKDSSKAKNCSDEELTKLLEKVKITKIIEREGGFDSVRNWDDILSLGEQQRLAMARLYYHQPSYAILDECTSAVSSDIEKQLYDSAKELGITIITISLRPALKAYHDYEFRFDGKGGYSVEKIDHDQIEL